MVQLKIDINEQMIKNLQEKRSRWANESTTRGIVSPVQRFKVKKLEKFRTAYVAFYSFTGRRNVSYESTLSQRDKNPRDATSGSF